MNIAILGYSGLIGKNLLHSNAVKNSKLFLYNSSNIEDIVKHEYDIIYICAPSATKWKINLEPFSDLENILHLLKKISLTKTKKIFLFSTVDVYGTENDNKMEDDKIVLDSVDFYGLNRNIFERYLLKHAEEHNIEIKIVRLPALYGKYLKKNVLYDLLNDNVINNISKNTSFQWINISKIEDIIYISNSIEQKVVNYVSQPIETFKILDLFFKNKSNLCNGQSNTSYNIKTKYSKTGYFLNKEEVIKDMTEFLEGN